MMNKTPTTLIIMDGFGLTVGESGNAVHAANTPRLNQFFSEHAHTTLRCSGLDVGLPDGQMGNSEVGHTNIGAGRVVFQDLPRITKAIADGDFFTNEAYVAAMNNCLEKTHQPPPDGPSVRRWRSLPPRASLRSFENGKG